MTEHTNDLVDYESDITENLRWADFEFRPDDIVISAPPKSGTTWTQQLVGSLIFAATDMPGTVAELSPWLDMKIRSKESVFSILEQQTHRRFIKTHTPLDGVQWSDDVTYVCVGRDPRDAAISMTHHLVNLDGEALQQITASMDGSYDPSEPLPEEMPPDFFIREWGNGNPEPPWPLDSFANIYRSYWDRSDRPNVGLFHFADYVRDLEAEVRRLADLLEIDVDDDTVAGIAARSRIDAVRSNAEAVAPDAHLSPWKDAAAFFRSGLVGEWREYYDDEDTARYDAALSELVPADLASWMADGPAGDDID